MSSGSPDLREAAQLIALLEEMYATGGMGRSIADEVEWLMARGVRAAVQDVRERVPQSPSPEREQIAAQLRALAIAETVGGNVMVRAAELLVDGVGAQPERPNHPQVSLKERCELALMHGWIDTTLTAGDAAEILGAQVPAAPDAEQALRDIYQWVADPAVKERIEIYFREAGRSL